MKKNKNRQSGSIPSKGKMVKDFVATDNKRNRICVRGIKDNFGAVRINSQWERTYPKFDDLMNNYSELMDSAKAQQHSFQARSALKYPLTPSAVPDSKSEYVEKKALFQSQFGNIYYELFSAGRKETIILTHGAGMDHKTFELQVNALISDYDVLVWDLPGHGLSTINEHKERFTFMSADCLNDLMNEVGVSKAIFVGQSLGSMVVQYFQIKHPQKVIATIHLPGIELKPHVGSWAKALVPVVMYMLNLIPSKAFYRSFGKHRAKRKDVQKYISETVSQTGKKRALEITKDMVYDLIDRFPEPAKAPLLITCGNNDSSFIRNAAKKWHKRENQSHYVEIENANHIANQDNPEEFNKVLVGFISDLHT